MRNVHNPDCSGSHCRSERGEVRVFPLGSGGNLILCYSCFAHENRYRHVRGMQTQRPDDWPEVDWSKAARYPEDGRICQNRKCSMYGQTQVITARLKLCLICAGETI